MTNPALIDGLSELGFDVVQRSRDGTMRFARRRGPYLVFWINGYPDGTADLTWEFSLGQFLVDRGFVVSGQDELSLLLFPKEEIRGTLDAAWAAEAVERAERALGVVESLGG